MYSQLLTNDTIIPYLQQRQLLPMDEVVKGNLMIIPIKTRNNIMMVKVSPEHSLFVKQLADDFSSVGLLKREVCAYRFLQEEKKIFSESASLPTMLFHDEEKHVLITKLVEGASSLHEYYIHKRSFDPSLAEEQAAILAAFHVTPGANVDTSAFPRMVPWVLQISNYNEGTFFGNNQASTRVISIIKANPLLAQQLIRLSASWSFTHLIHGDIKWINFLIAQNNEGTTQKLIDWELADIGDPVWDVAGLLQSYLSGWLFGFDNSNPQGLQRYHQMDHFNLSNMQASAQAFLQKYMALKQITGAAQKVFLIRVMEFTAVRILQTCIEGVTTTSNIEANNIRGVQLAFNILSHPENALRELIHITSL